jgi:Uma2 family endonuclease
MSTLALSPLAAYAQRPTTARPVKWTCARFHQLGDMGWFEGKTAMLIDGEILEMAGPNPPHTTATEVTLDALRAAFGRGFYVRGQQPLELGLFTDPVPDAVVVPGSARDYAGAHPTTALLVVEVSESSLADDLGFKADLDAAGGIRDYWVVDLVNRRLVVHRDPRPNPARPGVTAYATVTAHAPGQSVAPLAAPRAAVVVADLLP